MEIEPNFVINKKSALELRKRRALFRAQYRGTREMDWILGRFAKAQIACMSDSTLQLFEALLALPEPDIERILTLDPDDISDKTLRPLIQEIRAFHGFDKTTKP